jgi:predicted ATPase
MELLGLLASRPIPHKLVVVITHRPELRPTWYAPRIVPISLNRISVEDAERIVADVVRESVLADSTLREVIARADGVPLYLEEITKCVLESMQAQAALAAASSDNAEPGGPSAAVPIAIPPTVRDSLVERIDRLGAGKPLLQLAATLGHSFSFALLDAVADLDSTALRTELDRLVALGLLRRSSDPPHESYIFHHSLIEDAAYESLLRSTRQALHKRAAEVLVAGIPDAAPSSESEPHLLARHYAPAGNANQPVAQSDLPAKRPLAPSAYAVDVAIFAIDIENPPS